MNERDKLTGVYTRNAFIALADEVLRNNPGKQYDIVLSDFVGFKYFNERFGTEKGDLLLIRTGEMLSRMAPGTLCGRYGADRFVTLVERLPAIAVDFLNSFQLPPDAHKEFPVESVVVKFGICHITDRSSPISVYCDRAMLAVESVKHRYGKNLAVYDDNIGADALNEILIEENMQAALKEQQFEVYYQPKVDLRSGKTCGAEALVRWQHPTMGFMNPGIFIPLFEKNGFITELDIYTWDKVCSDMARWRAEGRRPIPISVNASRKDFDKENLSEIIIQIMDTYQLEHSMLHVEVTESSYSDDPETIVKGVDQMAKAGIIIELDDFGTGYTSLSCLNDMHIDIIKLDMSLLKNEKKARNNVSSLALATSIAQMMKVVTVQEGVETAEEVEKIKALGTEIAQGFYYSKPLQREEFEKWLEMN